jgi:hypothetical protein
MMSICPVGSSEDFQHTQPQYLSVNQSLKSKFIDCVILFATENKTVVVHLLKILVALTQWCFHAATLHEKRHVVPSVQTYIIKLLIIVFSKFSSHIYVKT